MQKVTALFITISYPGSRIKTLKELPLEETHTLSLALLLKVKMVQSSSYYSNTVLVDLQKFL